MLMKVFKNVLILLSQETLRGYIKIQCRIKNLIHIVFSRPPPPSKLNLRNVDHRRVFSRPPPPSKLNLRNVDHRRTVPEVN
jgi:hypothetical protein